MRARARARTRVFEQTRPRARKRTQSQSVCVRARARRNWRAQERKRTSAQARWATGRLRPAPPRAGHRGGSRPRVSDSDSDQGLPSKSALHSPRLARPDRGLRALCRPVETLARELDVNRWRVRGAALRRPGRPAVARAGSEESKRQFSPVLPPRRFNKAAGGGVTPSRAAQLPSVDRDGTHRRRHRCPARGPRSGPCRSVDSEAPAGMTMSMSGWAVGILRTARRCAGAGAAVGEGPCERHAAGVTAALRRPWFVRGRKPPTRSASLVANCCAAVAAGLHHRKIERPTSAQERWGLRLARSEKQCPAPLSALL